MKSRHDLDGNAAEPKWSGIKQRLLAVESFRYAWQSMRDIRSGVGGIRNLAYNYRVYRRAKHSMHISQIGPHSIELYRRFCKEVRNRTDIRMITQEQQIYKDINRRYINLVLRHDIDTPECIEKLPMLCDAEEAVGLRSSIYVLVCGESYRPSEVAHLVSDYRNRGFYVGLHTVAHSMDNPEHFLAWEMQEFENQYGFRPTTFILHGVYPRPNNFAVNYRLFKKRIRGIEKMLHIRGFRPFSLADAHLSDKYTEFDSVRCSVLRTPMQSVLDAAYRGGSALVITHPVHWKSGSGE